MSSALAFRGVFRRENAERVRQARSLCPLHNFRQVLGERVIREMTMRVNHVALGDHLERAATTSISTSAPAATRLTTCTVLREGLFGCVAVPKNCV